jgi:hypothetical protein
MRKLIAKSAYYIAEKLKPYLRFDPLHTMTGELKLYWLGNVDLYFQFKQVRENYDKDLTHKYQKYIHPRVLKECQYARISWRWGRKVYFNYGVRTEHEYMRTNKYTIWN